LKPSLRGQYERAHREVGARADQLEALRRVVPIDPDAESDDGDEDRGT
jgi:hypothetical protein